MAAAPFFLSLFLLAPIVRTHTKGKKKKKEEDFLFHPVFLSFPRCLEPIFKLSVPGRGDFFPLQPMLGRIFVRPRSRKRASRTHFSLPKKRCLPRNSPKKRASPSVKSSPPPPFCLARAKQHFLTRWGAVEINDGKRKTKKCERCGKGGSRFFWV